jgi:hypothetical protein
MAEQQTNETPNNRRIDPEEVPEAVRRVVEKAKSNFPRATETPAQVRQPPDHSAGHGPVSYPLPVVHPYVRETRRYRFFMDRRLVIDSHYDGEKVKGSYLCLRNGCPACAAGVETEVDTYLTAWDPLKRRIVALHVGYSDCDLSWPIQEFLEKYRDQLANVLAKIVRRRDITITAHRPLPGTDLGRPQCQAFLEDLSARRVTLQIDAKLLSAKEIAELPSMKPVVGEVVLPTPKTAGAVTPKDRPKSRRRRPK